MKQVHPKSQTTAILYQQPTAAEMKSKSSVFIFISNFMSGLVIVATVVALTLMTVRGCSNDVDHQEYAAVKHQAQFAGESK